MRGHITFAIAVVAGVLVSQWAAEARSSREAFIGQVSPRLRSDAYLTSAPGRGSISIAFRSDTTRASGSPIPAYAAPGLQGDAALGFFLNNNRGWRFERDWIFRAVP